MRLDALSDPDHRYLTSAQDDWRVEWRINSIYFGKCINKDALHQGLLLLHDTLVMNQYCLMSSGVGAFGIKHKRLSVQLNVVH